VQSVKQKPHVKQKPQNYSWNGILLEFFWPWEKA